MWLTDISPYLFMLNDGEDRRFKYAGANKGDLDCDVPVQQLGEWNPSGQRHVRLQRGSNLTAPTTTKQSTLDS